jgi:hypothetical protein
MSFASSLSDDKRLSGESRLINICHLLKATDYINSIGGTRLYTAHNFAKAGLKLSFLKTHPIIYRQFSAAFVPNLSIIDVMMFNSVETIRRFLNKYELVNDALVSAGPAQQPTNNAQRTARQVALFGTLFRPD